MKIILIIIVIILVCVLVLAIKAECHDIYWNRKIPETQGGNGKIHYKGLGTEEETIETLLNRIYWVADSDGRNGKWKRSYIIAFISTLLIICAIYHRVPSAQDLILLVLCIFITVMASSAFFRFHSDRFAPYYIRRNVRFIQAKMNLTNQKPGPPPESVQRPEYVVLDTLLRT